MFSNLPTYLVGVVKLLTEKEKRKIRNKEEEINVILISLFCSRSKAVVEKIPILSSYIHCSVNNYYREEKSANYNKATHILV